MNSYFITACGPQGMRHSLTSYARLRAWSAATGYQRGCRIEAIRCVRKLSRWSKTGAHVYCCGPQRLIEPFAQRHILGPAKLYTSKHSRHCSTRASPPSLSISPSPRQGKPARAGGRSALEVLRNHGVTLPSPATWSLWLVRLRISQWDGHSS